MRALCYLPVGLAVALSALTASGEAVPSKGAVAFHADVILLPSRPVAEVAVAWRLPLASLVTRGQAAAPLTVVVTLETSDERGEAGPRRQWVLRDPVPPEGRTAVERTARLPLLPGRHRLRLEVEVLETGRSGKIESRVEVPSTPPPVSMTDLLVGYCAPDSGAVAADSSAGEPVRFGGVRPYPGGVFTDGAEVCVWFAVADTFAHAGVRPETDAAYLVRYRLLSGRDREVASGTLNVARHAATGEVVLRPGKADLPRGSYTLEVEVEHGGKSARKRAEFSVHHSRVEAADDPRRIRTTLAYIATEEELQALDRTPDSKLADFWSTFWARRDPDSATRINETQALFVSRVEFATRRFGGMEPGWQTDMGRIYILYGEPDRVERVSRDADRAASEIWYYSHRDLTFIFQDADGFGRYRLTGGRN